MNLLFEERVISLDPIFGPMGLEAGRSIWATADFSGREKTAILLAADVSVPELGLPFELHVAMGLRQVGMPVEHLRELLRHVALYAGYNITAMAFERLAAIAKELGFDPASRPEPASSPQRVVYSEAVRSQLQRLDPSLAADFEQQTQRAWNRPGLTMRERCLATLAVDVVGGTLGAPFEAHVDLATRAGLSDRALRSLIRILAEFSMPKAWQALSALDVRSTRLRQT